MEKFWIDQNGYQLGSLELTRAKEAAACDQ